MAMPTILRTASASVSAPAPAPAVELLDVRFTWPGEASPCVDVPQLRIERGRSLFVHGPSGSGKTTLLSLLALVLRPQAGIVRLLGSDTTALRAAARDRFRAEHVGYIFQQFNLLPYLSVRQNVELGARLSPARSGRVGKDAATDLLRALAIDPPLFDRQASALSVGQQQRVAAARALLGDPELVIADEPTSALDAARRDEFMSLLRAAVERCGSTLVFVSHDLRLADGFDDTLDLGAVIGHAVAAPCAETQQPGLAGEPSTGVAACA